MAGTVFRDPHDFDNGRLVMNSDTAQRTHSGPPSWTRLLTRSPRVIPSPGLRATATALILVGAVLTIISGVIHLYLWGETNGYREIATIGPLFLVQGISALIIGVATAALRWLVAVLAAAGLLAGTAAGLFGFRESWGAPYARSSFYEEIAGAVLLLIAAWLLAVRKAGQH
jgi:hypothetical protein